MAWTLRQTAERISYGAGILFAESMAYAYDDYMHSDPLTKFIKYGTLLLSAGAALCATQAAKAADRQEIEKLIDSIGAEEPPPSARRSSPTF